MSQAYGPVYLHIILGTKHRQPFLTPTLHAELEVSIAPILKNHKARLIAEGGVPDHLHLLVDLGREVSVASILREIKTKTSNLIRKRTGKEFNWQAGYGVFSVDADHLKDVTKYIETQEKYHSKKTFQEEFEEMLKKAGVEFDPRYLLSEEEEPQS